MIVNRTSFLCLTLSTLVFFSCSSVKKSIVENDLFQTSHTGFYLYDPATKKVLEDINGSKYFIPASNTKIFTLYGGLQVLGDSIPTLKYVRKEDSLMVWGTGDPTFLSPDFQDSAAYEFLVNADENIFLSFSNFHDTHLGPGWAWSDYNYGYSLEKSPIPVFGNFVTYHKGKDTSRVTATPKYFGKYLYPDYNVENNQRDYLLREINSNITHYTPKPDSVEFTRYIPIHWSPQLVQDVLSDTLNRKVVLSDYQLPQDASTLYSVPSDSVYKRMMQVSDNFVAEQILLMISNQVSDTLKSRIAIDYILENHMNDLPDPPVWRDGSGLSRYNLFTPRTITSLLNKIYNEKGIEWISNVFATGGKNGTIRNWYATDPPILYAKTGTLSNNHCLSGFIKTSKGKILIFSFMHNNYNNSSTPFKIEMEKVLKMIYEKY